MPMAVTELADGSLSLSERAYLRIRDQIITLSLPPGSVIEESRLRQELGFGRTPIREALRRLAQEDLVAVIPNRGTFVAGVTITDLAAITEIRVELEGFAFRLAAERATPNDCVAIYDLIAELDAIQPNAEALGSQALMELDQRLHQAVYRATHNRFLEDALERYFRLSLRLWYMVLDRVRMEEAVQEHREILEAIIAGDGSRAESAIRGHVVAFEDAVRKVL
jgi:DNA-binding GntR family transcriptional regulator